MEIFKINFEHEQVVGRYVMQQLVFVRQIVFRIIGETPESQNDKVKQIFGKKIPDLLKRI